MLRLIIILKNHTSLDIALFCCRLLKGYGVDLVVSNQAKYLASWGNKVTIYTLVKDDFIEKSLTRFGNIKVEVVSIQDLSKLPNKVTCDVAIAQTDPFFDLVLQLNPCITKIAWDHGEPNPEFFPEEMARRKAQKEVRKNNHLLYHKTVAISEFIKQDMGFTQADIVYCGSDHLLLQCPQYYQVQELIKTRAIQEGYSQEIFDKPFLLCVSRLGEIYRKYKGTDDLSQLRKLTNLPIMLVGKSDQPSDVEHFKNQGLICLDNLSNEELISAYLNCTAVVSLSTWEGYNLPLVEAISLGKMSFALDRGAHRETGAKVAATIEDLAKMILSNLEFVDNYQPPQTLYSWKDHVKQLNSIIYETRLQHLTTLLGDNSKKVIPFLIQRVTLPRIRKILQQNQSNLYLKPQTNPDISVLILSKDKIELLKPCLDSIFKTFSNINYEVIIGDTGSEKPETEAYYYSIPHQVIYLGKYNFSQGNNDLVHYAKGKYLLLLNNNTESLT